MRVPLAKHQVGIDGMLTSDKRHAGIGLEDGLDDWAFEVQWDVGSAAGSTSGVGGNQESVH
jgi:hypothetical protein